MENMMMCTIAVADINKHGRINNRISINLNSER